MPITYWVAHFSKNREPWKTKFDMNDNLECDKSPEKLSINIDDQFESLTDQKRINNSIAFR